MSTLHNLTRRLTKLQATLHVDQAPNFAVIFYDSTRPDKDAWLEQETARVLEAGAGHIKTLFYMPEKELIGDNAAAYAAYRG